MSVARHEKAELLRAAQENCVQPLRTWLEKGGRLEDVRNKEKQTLLHLAACEGSEDVLAMLLRTPRVLKSIDCRDSGRRTPLHLAAAFGFDNCVHRLMDARAAIEKHDTKGCTPLLLAVKFEWPQTANILLKAGANPLDKDKHGHSSADIAVQKQDAELIPIVLDFAQRRQPAGRWGQLLQQFRAAGGCQKQSEPREEAPAGLSGRSEREASDLEIQMQGDEPVLVRTGASNAQTTDDIKAGQSSASGSRIRATSAPPARYSPPARPQAPPPQGFQELAAFRRHVFFPEGVMRLEMEVEWKTDQPRVGMVKPGGEAESRGLCAADRIVEISGTRAAGKGRDELLPLLKVRPMLVKVDRDERIRAPATEPHIQLQVAIGSDFQELGLELAKLGELPAVSRVQLSSDAWAAGILEGDAIVRVGGQFTGGLSRASMTSLLEKRGVITVWRRPLGMDLLTPWKPVADDTE